MLPLELAEPVDKSTLPELVHALPVPTMIEPEFPDADAPEETKIFPEFPADAELVRSSRSPAAPDCTSTLPEGVLLPGAPPSKLMSPAPVPSAPLPVESKM